MRPVNRVVPETEDPKAARERELHRHLQASYAQALAGDLISEEESLARVEKIESGEAE